MEKLYNGIVLPEVWPPRRDLAHDRGALPVPYLVNRPDCVPIDVGRQLFVDDFLIDATDLTRVYYAAKKYEGNPVFKPETFTESGEGMSVPGAGPKSGGVWFDPRVARIRMWYEAGWLHRLALAESEDGIHWTRPVLDARFGTNHILPSMRPDSTSFVIDPHDPVYPYKMFLRAPGGGDIRGVAAVSRDGVHFERFTATGHMGDRSTMFYNPFRRKWVYSIRSLFRGRTRDYFECDDPIAGAPFTDDMPVQWLRTDDMDKEEPGADFEPQLYNVDAVAYESLMLGMFQIHLGPENGYYMERGVPKLTELQIMFSRDGFHFDRPERKPFIAASRVAGAWDRGYVQSTGGMLLVSGDELLIYYIGFAGDETNLNPVWAATGMYANFATGIAKLRRDGFASMTGDGRLTTRKIRFSGKELFVNASGFVRAELLDEEGQARMRSLPFEGDSTRARIRWESGGDLALYAGRDVRLRFTVRGSLYAFWVSKDDTGESGGYPGGGAIG